MSSKRASSPGLSLWIGITLLIFIAGVSLATERYNGATADYCVNCHPTFQGRNELHDLHVGNGQFTSNCDLCHVGTGDNPLLMYSDGDNADGLGCMGCHGHDYGETILQDYGLGLMGRAKNSGYGLRLQHTNKGVLSCVGCHGESQTPVPENIDPPYYARADVDITNACNTDGTEDSSPEALRCQGNLQIPCEIDADCGTDGPCISREDSDGLDNDGDTLIDAADPDCAPSGTPGESGGPGLSPLLVTTHDPAAGTLALTVGVPCGGTDMTVVWGPLTSVGTYGYTGQDCSMDNSGAHTWTFGPASESLFFLIVSNDGAIEGSYGTDHLGAERPEDIGGAVCPYPQNLVNRCD